MTRTIAAATLFVLAAIGCSSSSSTPSLSDASDAALVDAVSADGSENDAATDTADGGCNTLVPLGTLIAAACASGPPPAATGGTIVDGTYVLTDSRFFGACAPSELQETLIVSQGVVQSLATTATGDVIRRSLSYEVTGANMVQTQTCPGTAVTRGTFTATPTSLTIFLPNALTTRVSVFTRL